MAFNSHAYGCWDADCPSKTEKKVKLPAQSQCHEIVVNVLFAEKEKSMRYAFLIPALFVAAVWFYAATMLPTSSGPANASGSRGYENYRNNTVAKPTWNENDDQMVLVNVAGFDPYLIDKYEATISQQRAWSVPGQFPTTRLTFKDAKDACAKAGKRLCSTEEWRIACRDGQTKPYYFPNTKVMLERCDFGRSKGYDKNDHANKTDSHPKCTAPRLKIHHMYGNIVEMTQGPNGEAVVLGMTYLGTKYYGAAFEGKPNEAMRQACEYTVINDYSDGRRNEGLGFRCCKDGRA